MKTTTSLLVAFAVVLSLNTPPVMAADQPKPGPDHKKLEMQVGEWTYEGSGVASPFLPAAGKFKGKFTSRMVLGGFFLESRGEDTSDNAYIYQNIALVGFDPTKEAYVTSSFENDGTVTTGTMTIRGDTWTTTGTRTDSKGKVYRLRTVNTFSADGKTSTDVTEYSGDNGNTWSKAWGSTATKVGL